MNKNDKIIAAFLVSLGIFTATQAVQYIATLSTKEKGQIAATAKKSDGRIILCSGVDTFNSPVDGSGQESNTDGSKKA